MEVINIRYDTGSVFSVEDLNSSFAKGSLKVMYTGANRNGSFISKEAVTSALPSLYNVPIVAHYDFETNEIGGHDTDVREDADGHLKLCQLTEPCGVVPESATFRFVTENGKEYLVIDNVLLWKRQDVYKHIVDDLDGKVDHSMEIAVKESNYDEKNNYVNISKFEFQALCLLETAKPCFEGSELELYSAVDFKQKMQEMMADLKNSFSTVFCNDKENSTKGGKCSLDTEAILSEYNLTAEDIDFELDGMDETEIRQRFEEIAKAKFEDEDPETDLDGTEGDGNDSGNDPDGTEGGGTEGGAGESGGAGEGGQDPEVPLDDGDDDTAVTTKRYSLAGEDERLLREAVYNIEIVETEWGKYARYWFEDYDAEVMEVYCRDTETWHLYGFKYERKGDDFACDAGSKKRKKVAFVDFDEGDVQPEPYIAEAFAELKGELENLSKFKADTEKAVFENTAKNIFAKFNELNGNEMFETLKENYSQYTAEQLEEKCFAIKGRLSTAKFSKENEWDKKIHVEAFSKEVTPYGDLFERFGN